MTDHTQLRHIALEGQANFRDLGGYHTYDDRTVKWGQIYRSGRLPTLTDADVAQLQAIGMRTVVTLLTPDDIKAYGPDRVPDGVVEIALAIDSETATELSNRATAALKSGDFSAIPPDLNPAIHRLLIQDGVERYAALLRLIADPANRPLVFHCSHGIHRTGTGAAILLSALGVSWETVRADYLLSNEYRRQEVENRLEQLRRMAAAKQGVAVEEVDMTNMNAFLIQEGSYIDASRDEMIAANGSIEDYIRLGLGLSNNEVGQLQASLLDKPEHG